MLTLLPVFLLYVCVNHILSAYRNNEGPRLVTSWFVTLFRDKWLAMWFSDHGPGTIWYFLSKWMTFMLLSYYLQKIDYLLSRYLIIFEPLSGYYQIVKIDNWSLLMISIHDTISTIQLVFEVGRFVSMILWSLRNYI